jgi:hypothetical protein
VAVKDIAPVPGERFEDTLASASPDPLRETIRGFAQRMMDVEVETLNPTPATHFAAQSPVALVRVTGSSRPKQAVP